MVHGSMALTIPRLVTGSLTSLTLRIPSRLGSLGEGVTVEEGCLRLEFPFWKKG